MKYFTGDVIGFLSKPLVCSSVYSQCAWCACDTVRIMSYTARDLESDSLTTGEGSLVSDTRDVSSPRSLSRSRDLFGTRPYRTAESCSNLLTL